MKFSWHAIVVDNFPSDGQSVVYSTRTQGMVTINRELKDLIEDFGGQPEAVRVQYREDLATLRQMGIVVENEQEDIDKLGAFLQQLKYGVDESCFPVTILTTYACNFKCTYCFEESSRASVKMDFETAGHVMDWLKEKLTKFGYRKLHITFYGGEPLLNKPVLEHIASQMKLWCESRGIAFQFMLQTNGYLMTPELIDRYLALGLKNVRISVDGVDGDHDRNRPLRGGGGTFATIIRNISACADKVPIGISTAYDKGSTDNIKRLLDYFDDLGLLPKLGRFIFSPVHATLGPKDHPELVQNSSCMCNYEDENLLKATRRIRELMAQKGLPMKSGMSISTCPVTRDKSGVTVDQHGRIFQCNSMLGHPELSTGDVRDNHYNDRHREFVELDVWRQCPQDCTYLPMCSGGCRLASFLKSKNFRVPSCHKPYLNRIAPEIIKEEYRQAREAAAKNNWTSPEKPDTIESALQSRT